MGARSVIFQSWSNIKSFLYLMASHKPVRELFLNPAPFTVDLTSMWTTTKNKNRTSPDKQIIKFQTSVAVSRGHCNGSLAHLPPTGINWLKTLWTTVSAHRRADHRRTDLCDLMESSDHRWRFGADRWNRWGSPRPLEPNGGAKTHPSQRVSNLKCQDINHGGERDLSEASPALPVTTQRQPLCFLNSLNPFISVKYRSTYTEHWVEAMSRSRKHLFQIQRRVSKCTLQWK